MSDFETTSDCAVLTLAGAEHSLLVGLNKFRVDKVAACPAEGCTTKAAAATAVGATLIAEILSVAATAEQQLKAQSQRLT